MAFRGIQDLEQHDFVTTSNGLGVGQLARLRNSKAEIVYFDSVTNPDAHREVVPLENVSPQVLEIGRCCFVPVERGWQPGRVLSHELNRYSVSLPGGERWLGPSDFRVRWDRPASSPIEDLVGGWWSSASAVERRVAFLGGQGWQNEIACGLTGATSTAVEMHEHQIDIVKRILDDPIGRFILADEVGIGKTIEALMVVRQMLVDDPELVVRVVVPEHLRAQWTDEMLQRAQIDPRGGKGDFPLAAVEVLSHDHDLAWGSSDSPDVLVVDEAHHIATWAHSDLAAEQERYNDAVVLAQATPLVLLLSATPSLHKAEVFLALLHLLDPDLHRLEDLDEFPSKLALRDDLSSALLSVDPEDPPEMIIDGLNDLRALVAGEAELRDPIDELARELAEVESASPEQAIDIEKLRARVAEAYSVDRRLLRTRRRAIEKRFPVRGRRRGTPIEVAGESYSEAARWFDAWRIALLADRAERVPRDELEGLCALVAEVCMAAPGLIAPLARLRLGNASDEDRDTLGLSDQEIDRLEAVDVGPQERLELEDSPDLGQPISVEVAEAIAEFVFKNYRARDRILVVSAWRGIARQVASELESRLRKEEVEVHMSDTSPTEQRRAVDAFVDDGGCHVLVVDTSARDGLNLQSADVILLLDSPLAVDRLEQQLGRADRFSRSKPVEIVSLTPIGESGIRSAWEEVLGDGFRVFDRSLAALQFAVTEALEEVRRALLDGGAVALRELVDAISGRMKQGELELTKSELLDATTAEGFGRAVATELGAFDEDAEGWKGCVRGLLRSDLRLPEWSHADGTLSYWLSHPRLPWVRPAIDGRYQAKYFVAVVSQVEHAKRGTYDRTVAAEAGEVRVLRAGNPLLDATERYLYDQATEGRAAAIWRRTERLPGGSEAAGFVFSYGVHAPPPDAFHRMKAVEQAALMRRVVALLGDTSTEVVVSADGVVLDPEEDLGFVLAMPFSKRMGDSTLGGSAIEVLATYFPGSWESAVRNAHRAAGEEAERRLLILGERERRSAARSETERRMGIVEARRTGSAMGRERRLGELIEVALEKASVRLQGVKTVIVSDKEFKRSGPAKL